MPTPTSFETSIEIDSVTVGYRQGLPILEGLSLSMSGPGLYRVAGSNGSGKSTFLELISGFLQPWAGSVRLCGIDAGSPDARHVRSVCRTTPALYPSMTVRDHLALAARSRQVGPEAGLARLAKYGLQDWAEQPVSMLSTGNIRKLWLLMCTVADTPVVAIDEPFNGMDLQGIEALICELGEWAQHKVVVLISHTVPDQLTVSHSFVFKPEGATL
ncbi:ATP-binding cassette domain-containing protein [Arthrobacter bambusae]|jgi:ABC-type multidrug transport system ATPase subunit|uniref:ABC transporter ATP-binding protein n=2 Tax=Arthrobacter TaxID=1663 RepID=UPI001F50FC91|nr:ATP-binding cassette domain-containing protein [Arthrobacter bambusae]MCI0143664.1 ATP-binding cassette domain-containing protein [Arthrobacter bambusae]